MGNQGVWKMTSRVIEVSPDHWNKQGPEEAQYFTSGNLRFRLSSRSCVWSPPTDVYETEDAVIVRVEVAGMREEDFEINLEERFLTIRGSRPDIVERRAYHQLEIPFGEFISDVELPAPVIADQIIAIYQSGFLRLVLPKTTPHQIRVDK
jgi:HSP20 family protein